eukprot:TRINITY_DN2834_c0_g1_i1.p1 TRINITY_DN2834_c0_g1~~TRINITY_DN2834_c0_g1_i1.p1  ORF type:complete len:256 (+),score=50.88 TRINITY_DN2834_c0_g1_i1:116-883(+)
MGNTSRKNKSNHAEDSILTTFNAVYEPLSDFSISTPFGSFCLNTTKRANILERLRLLSKYWNSLYRLQKDNGAAVDFSDYDGEPKSQKRKKERLSPLVKLNQMSLKLFELYDNTHSGFLDLPETATYFFETLCLIDIRLELFYEASSLETSPALFLVEVACIMTKLLDDQLHNPGQIQLHQLPRTATVMSELIQSARKAVSSRVYSLKDLLAGNNKLQNRQMSQIPMKKPVKLESATLENDDDCISEEMAVFLDS